MTLCALLKAKRNTAQVSFLRLQHLVLILGIEITVTYLRKRKALDKIKNETSALWCCAQAWQSGGAFAFALIFLLLFASRQKVN
jgi:hypothetical protein